MFRLHDKFLICVLLSLDFVQLVLNYRYVLLSIVHFLIHLYHTLTHTFIPHINPYTDIN